MSSDLPKSKDRAIASLPRIPEKNRLDTMPQNRNNRFQCPIDVAPAVAFVRAVWILTVLTTWVLLVGNGTVLGDQFGISRRLGDSSLQPSPHANPALSTSAPPPAAPAQSAPKTGAPFALPFTNPLAPKIPAGSRLENPLPNVVRIVAFDKDGQSFGSGSYIGSYEEYGVILSNWHVVADGNGLIHVHFPGGFSSFGAIVQSDVKWDLAAIVVSRPPSDISALPISKTAPRPGEPLWIAGHGSGSYRLAGGRCVRYLAPEIPQDGTPPLYEIIELSVSARQGDSGGPILNRDGELAGVLFGSDMVRNTAGSFCERANRFLLQTKPLIEKLPKRPEVHFVSVEPDGPRHRLSDTQHAVPPEKATPHALVASPASQRSVDFGGGSSFGVRSPSRRYTRSAPASPIGGDQPSQTPVSSISSELPRTEADLPSPTAPVQAPPTSYRTKEARNIQPAAWTSPAASVSRSKNNAPAPSSERGLGIPDPFDNGLVSLNPDPDRAPKAASEFSTSRPTVRKAETGSKYGRSSSDRGLATVSERNETLHPNLILGGVLIAILLVYASIRLLRNEPSAEIPDEAPSSICENAAVTTKSREANAA